jgi:replicative DNA helicase
MPDGFQPEQPLDLPHSEECEMAILGALMYDNRALERVPFLHPNHFSILAHRSIYAAIQHAVGDKGSFADPITLKDRLAADPDFVAAGGYAYLVKLAAAAPPVVHIGDYGRLIFDLAARRDAIAAAQDLMRDAGNDELEQTAAALARSFADRLTAIADGSSLDDRKSRWTSQEAAEHAMGKIARAMSNRGAVPGVTTGIVDLDRKIGGLQAPQLIILAGRPGMGKSALATSIARGAARSNRPGAFFTLEMSADELAQRFLSDLTGVPHEDMKRGDVSEEGYMRLLDARAELDRWPIMLMDAGGQSLAEIAMEARSLKRRGKLEWVIVDYLQIIGVPKSQRQSENRTQEVSKFTAGLKALAKDLDVPVIALSQLSRNVESRDDKRPMLADLRDSGSIEQDADAVWFVYREHYYLKGNEPQQRASEEASKFLDRQLDHEARLKATEGVGDLIIAKNRHGSTATLKLAWDGPRSAWGDLEQRYG